MDDVIMTDGMFNHAVCLAKLNEHEMQLLPIDSKTSSPTLHLRSPTQQHMQMQTSFPTAARTTARKHRSTIWLANLDFSAF